MSITGDNEWAWPSGTTGLVPLDIAAGSGTISACWFAPNSFDLNIDLTDSLTHQVALYSTNLGSTQQFDVSDANTGHLLDSKILPGTTGEYIIWDLDGDVTIQVTNLGPDVNANINAIFFGGAAAPTVVTPAAASSNPVTGTTAGLSVLGADANYPESDLTYTWSTTSAPTGAPAPIFSPNGTNAAQNTTAAFGQAGNYTFQVTTTDPVGLTATSSVTVTLAPTLTAIVVDPASATVADAATQTLTATGNDQFGQALASQPSFAWSVDPGGAGGTINAGGSYTAPASGSGSDTVRASNGTVSGIASVTVTTATASASFVGTDTTTGSDWRSAYGGDGYDIVRDPSNNNPSLPSYAQVSITGDNEWTWPSGTTGLVPLDAAAGSGTISACWFAPNSFDLNIDLTDSLTHQVALYSTNLGSTQQFDVSEANTGHLLNSKTLPGTTGEYIVWDLEGDVTIQVTNLGPDVNANINAIFFGGAAGLTVSTPAAVSTNPVTSTTAGLSVLGTDPNYPESDLTYTWSTTSLPPGAPRPSSASTARMRAKDTTVSFGQAGTYTFLVTIADPGSLTVTSSVNV